MVYMKCVPSQHEMEVTKHGKRGNLIRSPDVNIDKIYGQLSPLRIVHPGMMLVII